MRSFVLVASAFALAAGTLSTPAVADDTSSSLARSRIGVRFEARGDATRDALAMRHTRLARHFGDVPVLGGDVVQHELPDGRIEITEGAHQTLDRVATTPRLSAFEAVVAACQGRESCKSEVSSLVVWAPANERAVLAWQVHLTAASLGDANRVMVDAVTGAIVARFDTRHALESVGVGIGGSARKLQVRAENGGVVLVDTTRSAGTISTHSAAGGTKLPGSLVQGNDNAWPASAVDAHYHMGVVYDFFKTSLHRSSIDKSDGPIVGTTAYGTNIGNAFWDTDARVLVFGDGVPGQRAPAAALDVVAHELMHGITQNDSQLIYFGESGALNEAVSDIFAAFVEHAVKPDDEKNFQCGEDLGFVIRDMANPVKFGKPSTMSELVRTQQDSGGVHTNGSVPSLAMKLMTVGGEHPKNHITLPKGLGWDTSLAVWYRASEHYFVSSTDFAGAADATLRAARDLSLSDGDIAIIECAWISVGLHEGACRGNQGLYAATLNAPANGTSIALTNSPGLGCTASRGRHEVAQALPFGLTLAAMIASRVRRRRTRAQTND